MVFATAVPESAPTKLSPAAMRIACHGASTRVAMTVAMAFAVSWNPLMKSKTTAASTTRPSRTRTLSMLDGDPLEHVGDVLEPVGHGLEVLVDLLPARHLEPVVAVVQEIAQRLARDAVGVVLVAVHLDDVLADPGELPAVAQRGNGGLDLGRGARDDPADLDGRRRRLLDLPEDELVGGLL